MNPQHLAEYKDTWTNTGIFQSVLRLSMQSDPAHDVCTESASAPVLCLFDFPAVQNMDMTSGAPDVILNLKNQGRTSGMAEQEAERVPQDFVAQSHLTSCGLPTTNFKGNTHI